MSLSSLVIVCRRCPTEIGTDPGAWLAVADPDAGATVPGVTPGSGDSEKVNGRSLVQESTAPLGKVFGSRFGDCPSGPSASGELVKNACKCAEGRAPEVGFRHSSSRMGVPNARASWFERDAPSYQASAEWLVYTAINELRLLKDQQVQPYRFAEGAPTSQFLRGALEGEGFAHQFAARAAALVFLLVSAKLTPTVSYRNRVMITEIITRAF